MVSPESLRFLVDNGYDLNRLVRDGVPYQPMTTLEVNYVIHISIVLALTTSTVLSIICRRWRMHLHHQNQKY
jgi:hypothetical protein